MFALSYDMLHFESIFEDWIQNIIKLNLKNDEIIFIIGFIDDFLNEKEFRKIYKVLYYQKQTELDGFDRHRRIIEKNIEFFLIKWLITSKNFLLLVEKCPKETISFYFKIFFRFYENEQKKNNLNQDNSEGNKKLFWSVQNYVTPMNKLNKNIKNRSKNKFVLNSFHDKLFENLNPLINEFCLLLSYSDNFYSHIWLLFFAQILDLKIIQSRISK